MDQTPSPSPPILRPIPRRPFDLNLRDPTPPPDTDSSPAAVPAGTPFSTSSRHPGGGGLTPSSTFDSIADSDNNPSLSRATSFLNLQKSTLFGIYQDSSQPSSPTPDDPSGTHWGTGVDTPLRQRPGVSDAMFEIMRQRRSGHGPGLGIDGDGAAESSDHVYEAPLPVWRDALSVVFRAALLFGLGVGYGVLVGKLRSDPFHHHVAGGGPPKERGAGETGWGHLLFWGFGGLVVGTLLPYFDGSWEARSAAAGGGRVSRRVVSVSEGRPPMDWSLVLRGITAFLGIVFAIRKLAWTSTMQVSTYLAAVNPFLWYLIDRSKTGFLMSAAFSLTGSAVLMGLDPDLMPVPTVARGSLRNATRVNYRPGAGGRSSSLPSDETIEKGVWMVSVLFCSCLCFGNIGRRLGFDRSAYGRGRWAGVR